MAKGDAVPSGLDFVDAKTAESHRLPVEVHVICRGQSCAPPAPPSQWPANDAGSLLLLAYESLLSHTNRGPSGAL